MVKPVKPTAPAPALRSNPDTFSVNAEGTITYMFTTFPDYTDAVADFVDTQADAALAAALGGDLPPLTGNALEFLRVNAGETAGEFYPFLSAMDDNRPVASQAQAEAGTATGVYMDPLRTAQAIDASRERGGAIVATTSGTAFDFTGIPAEVQEIEVLLDGVSLSGTDDIIVQLGTSGGIVTTGYLSSAVRSNGADGSLVTSTAGVVMAVNTAVQLIGGAVSFRRLSAGSNVWTATLVGKQGSNTCLFGSANITLAAELDRVRITRTGTNTFDAGQLNVRWK